MNNFILKARFITLGSAVALLPFSVRFCHLFLLLFIVACLCEGNFIQRGRIIVQNPLGWILPAFFLLHVVGILYSDNVSNGWANIDKKIAFGLAPLIIVSSKPFSKEEIKKLLWVFLIACVIGTIICLINAMVSSGSNVALWNFGPPEPYVELHPGASNKWAYFSYIGLASGIGIHPTYFSFYLLVCVLIALRTIDNRWLTMGVVIYLVAFIVLLSSRIVVLATVITLITAKKETLVAGVAAMSVVVLLNPLAFYRNLQEYTSSNFTIPPASLSDNPISIRTSLWWLSGQAISEINPVFGSGTGDVNDTIAILADKHNAHNILNTSDPHNQYLHTFIALGAVGLLALLAVFFAPLLMLFKQREFLACVGLIAFMVICLTESALELQKGIVLFSLFVSLTGNQFREWRFMTQRLKYA